MRKLEIKHPEYGKVGKLGQYDDRKLVQDKELPERVDVSPSEIKEMVLESVLKIMNEKR